MENKQTELLKEIKQQVPAHIFNKVCKVVELENKLTKIYAEL